MQKRYEWSDLVSELSSCNLCPHQCGVGRAQGETGICGVGSEMAVAAVVRHYGEEPVISGQSGICNVFFAHCTLQCVFCQNHQISDNFLPSADFARDPDEIVAQIAGHLEAGCHALGFVSATHMIPQMKWLIHQVRELGYDPVIVYNSNGYERVETLRSLEDWVDIYLPDFKYMDPLIAQKYSGYPDYPEVALAALREMYRQKGTSLPQDEHQQALAGLIVRHLVLPGNIENSFMVLDVLAETLSERIYLSLMSQYYPAHKAGVYSDLNRTLTVEEYQKVVHRAEALGFHRGWIQEPGSHALYRPDFNRPDPF